MTIEIYNGDCRDIMSLVLADCSVDAIVCDPPYELTSAKRTRPAPHVEGSPYSRHRVGVNGDTKPVGGFMGKEWDGTGVAFDVAVWAECLRVLKPGGHLLAFGGTRTYHRMVCAIEDAGFEVRDQMMWIYGSGFPKSLDVSKAIDKLDAAEERTARALRFTEWVRSTGLTSARIDALTGTNMGGHYMTAASQPAVATREHLEALRPHLGCDVPAWVEALVDERTVESENFKAREVLGSSANGIAGGTGRHAGAEKAYGFSAEFDLTAAHTPDAAKWQGWGTALKPAHEPIVVARKPLIGTVAANVLQFGTGAINVDGCRVSMSAADAERIKNMGGFGKAGYVRPRTDETFMQGTPDAAQAVAHDLGRWPANIIHDGSDEVLAAFPDSDGSAARFFYCAKASKRDRNEGCEALPQRVGGMVSNTSGQHLTRRDEGYQPVPTGNPHPTVKPTDLMRYLCRLVTPPGGTVLDPFTGSGSTGKAAVLEGFNFIGCELTAEYIPIIHARIAHALKAGR